MGGVKKWLDTDVLSAARERVRYVFDNFPKIIVSFSGGKDSCCMLHLVMDEAIKRNRIVGVLFVDLEGQYKLTIDHVLECYQIYSNWIDPYWICLPLHLRNAVSQFQSHWVCWDKSKKDIWIRNPPDIAIVDESRFPFFRSEMEFEEFVSEFGNWYSNGDMTACLIGIRSGESLNRWRTISSSTKKTFNGKKWTTQCGEKLYNVYPIYDWNTRDDWTYLAREKKCYNKLYDRMQQAGLSIDQMRICQPYGDDQRKGLWLFHVIEPETWTRIVARVCGANQGALYATESGNILGRIKISKPVGHTWESFARLLLASMPEQTQEHYKNKIAVFIHWWHEHGVENIPDDGELTKDRPSWMRIVKTLLKNDYWCKGLSFSQHKSTHYDRYKSLMKRRREEWGVI